MSNMRKAILLLLLYAFLTAVPTGAFPTAAQEETPSPAPLTPTSIPQTPSPTPQTPFAITPGSYEGNINDSTFTVRYSFAAKTGDNVTISMDATSGDLDPFLLLYGPTGRLLDTNDDAETGNRNAKLTLTPTADGTYVVEATRFDQDAGHSSGTYRLTLAIEGAQQEQAQVDPLSVPPDFAVDFTYINYEDYGAGTLDDFGPQEYFVLGGRQGDFVRIIMTTTSGDLVPHLNIRRGDLTIISQEAQTRPGETIAIATLPETGWYLIEATRISGTGSFDLYPVRLAGAVLDIGQTVSNTFTPDTPSISYIVNAHIGDNLIISLTLNDATSPAQPELTLLDLNLESISQRLPTDQQTTRIRARIPRSGPYILRIRNLRSDVTSDFSLTLGGIPVEISKLSIQEAAYNNRYKGTITNRDPVVYYRFSGKAGELVTLQMTADLASPTLDPFLILTDSTLNELAFNDNVGTTRNARIVQFALPADGDYFILATRPDLSRGTSEGNYDLALTVGEISLLPGSLTATLTWSSEADLNLFVRDSTGRTVSWSNPQVPSGGTLQIDSNTNCEIPSAQPVEHIYWPPTTTPPPGDYDIWVWYQNVCQRGDPVTFGLTLTVNGDTVLDVKPGDVTLQPDKRYEARIRVVDQGNSFAVYSGRITSPSMQQKASQGGDTPIVYSQGVTGTITDEVYALFYQFSGAAGDQIVITANTVTGTLDPVLVLRDPADNTLATNDDADASTRDSLLQYTLPADGQYHVAVSRYGLRDGTTTGDFRLTVTKIGGG